MASTSNLLSHFILIIRSIHFIFSRKDNIFFQQYYTPNQSSYQKQHPTSISLLIQYKSDQKHDDGIQQSSNQVLKHFFAQQINEFMNIRRYKENNTNYQRMTAESILRKTFFIHSGNIAISSDLTLRGYVRTVLKNDSKSFSSKRLIYYITHIGPWCGGNQVSLEFHYII